MNVEEETLLTSLFKTSFPESWRDNPDFQEYLSELSSFGIDRLNCEPERLAEEKSQILADTQQLAFKNYGAFIETAECSKEIFQDFQVIERSVDNVLEKIPKLADLCSEFTKNAKEINSNRKKASVALQKHTQLLELLEIPQLLDTCVRNGYYDEALELISHVRRLEKKFSSISIIESIVKDVAICSQLMLTQLIEQLRSNIQLPSCLKIIGYLRRMDVFTEIQLRMKYLHARDSWFSSVISQIPNDDSYIYLNRVIDLSRVHLFDIVTQYRAIFSDDESKYSSESVLIQEWIILRVNNFLNIVKANVVKDSAFNRIDSLLGQCMYFGLSFSRVGSDFRPLVAKIFRDVMLDKFNEIIKKADEQFTMDMQKLTLILPPPSSVTATIQSLQYNPNYPDSLNFLYYQPLTVYLNALLTSLNVIAPCCITNLAMSVRDKLENSLERASKEIYDYYKAEEQSMNELEIERFQKLCLAFRDELIPYINKCFGQIFPLSTTASILGLSTTQANRLMLGSLNMSKILEILKERLPNTGIDKKENETFDSNEFEGDKSSELDSKVDIDEKKDETAEKEEFEDTEKNMDKVKDSLEEVESEKELEIADVAVGEKEIESEEGEVKEKEQGEAEAAAEEEHLSVNS
ncbi:DgyrCDS7187 [Dimorphilus gyrociliatus]|uniref:Conserved oligomeric Golgi complex subunit 8 n=1 Tax=Dimorphilus gyrociliatus TaxID=2664684 RepID=A0A7I8VSK9_9ANNE|nr:DgyrCDS7187 [Dimorphilus gyrociliatus]